jgi:hypothetical protein
VFVSHINQSDTVTELNIITYPSNFVPLPDVGFVRVIWGQRWMDASAGATNGHQHYQQQLEIYKPVKI